MMRGRSWIVLALILACGACAKKTETDEAEASKWMQKAEEITAEARERGVQNPQALLKKLIPVYSKAIESDPNLELAYARRGAAFFILQKYRRALSDLTMAISLNPTDTRAFFGRAQCYAQMGRSDKAAEDYRRACDLGYGKACVFVPADWEGVPQPQSSPGRLRPSTPVESPWPEPGEPAG